ncbi:glycosyltransferase [Candidatus Sumerlaeota bacterium]|nr:glycosyltransferase [Candidatus Sumerlaeota bacterium]
MTTPEHKPLKILRVITWLPMGGIERRIAELLPALKERGHHIEVVCLREYGPLAEELRSAGIRVELIPLKSRLHPAGIRKLAQYIREGNFDVLHSHMYRSNVPATIAGKLVRFKGIILAQIHNIDTWETRRQLWMDRFLSRWRDGLIAVSEQVRQEIIQRLRVPPEKCFVIYNGIQIEKYRDVKPVEGIRESLGILPDDFVVIMVARMVAQKNHRLVIDSAPEIIKSVPKVKFLFVGDGRLRPELQEQVRAKGLERHFIFTGTRTDIPQLLKISDVFVLPSFKEGFSNAIVEAMAAGLPVIASRVGGNAEAVIDGSTGILISPYDSSALANAVIRLAKDTSLRQRMSSAGSKRAENFSISEMVRRTESLYYQLCREKFTK